MRGLGCLDNCLPGLATVGQRGRCVGAWLGLVLSGHLGSPTGHAHASLASHSIHLHNRLHELLSQQRDF